MKCPVDETNLAIAERQGVEIDYCPQCRGVWLDRGELDKIIERAERENDSPPPRERERERYRDEPHEQHSKPHKKKKSFLSEIFELGG